MIAKGKTVFTTTGLCFACHGMDAKGMVGPNLTDQTWIHGKGTYPEIVQIVTTGIPVEKTTLGKGAMAPKGGSQISEDDVKAVSAYVWSLSNPT
jgi:cytochrome c oxidase cbb3-type subunit 3